MNTNASFQSIADLDFAPIKRKLMHVQSGEGWSQEKADSVEKEYRRYLCIMKLYPGQLVSPTVDVDTFWHCHILDTMKYAVDCEQAFGYFLHHYPYVGMEGEDAPAMRSESGERMRSLYEMVFGEAYPGIVDEPEAAQAWCAGPHEAPSAQRAGAAQAWCAGPGHSPVKDAGAAQAYCGGEWPRIDRAPQETHATGRTPAVH